MLTYISILRGINVGGHKLVKMDVLRQIYIDLGFEKVQTYIQSGNVIFCSESALKQDLSVKIKEKILEKLSFDVPVIVIELEEFKEIINKNSFLIENTIDNQIYNQKDKAHFHITFLSEIPEKGLFDKVKEKTYQKDELELLDKSVYLYCPDGYGNSRLTNVFFETKLKVIATTRNWKTSLELLNMAEKTSK